MQRNQENALTQARADAATQLAELNRRVGQLQDARQELLEMIARQSRDHAAAQAQVGDRLSAVEKVSPEILSADFRLRKFIQDRAIFFNTDATFTRPEEAETAIRELAELARASGRGIRLVGHTDGTGSATLNRELAAKRAEIVLERLVQAGVPRENLTTVGRMAQTPIAASNSPDNVLNRRVSFEIRFANEAPSP